MDLRLDHGSSMDLRFVIRSKCQQNPGFYDGLLVNFQGVPYCQAQHGDDPLGAGFDICAPARPRPTRAQPPPAPASHFLYYLAAALVALYTIRRWQAYIRDI
jgi:hypothetical protein